MSPPPACLPPPADVPGPGPLPLPLGAPALQPMPFHTCCGRNVCLSPDRTVAVRLRHALSNGYAFTSRPVLCGQRLVIQVRGRAVGRRPGQGSCRGSSRSGVVLWVVVQVRDRAVGRRPGMGSRRRSSSRSGVVPRVVVQVRGRAEGCHPGQGSHRGLSRSGSRRGSSSRSGVVPQVVEHLGTVLLITVGRCYVGNDVAHSTLLDRACGVFLRKSS